MNKSNPQDNPQFHPHYIHFNRQSIRLKDYDYSQNGAYFITLCTHNRRYLFGELSNGVMQLNDAGKIVKQCWDDIPNHFPHVKLDEFVIMPNHVHGIIVFDHSLSKNLGSVVRGFKIGVTKWMRQNTTYHDVWQRNYFEHIIRSEELLYQAQEYIKNNPQNWHRDKLNITAMQ